jgi:hypothetical protein
MNATQLEQAFRGYFDEIDACRRAGCYWALLHMIIVLPDICAALQSPTGKTSGPLYQTWCDTYLPTGSLSGLDRYKVRCALLHEGSTLPAAGRYTSVSFTDPRHIGANPVHQVVDPSNPQNITVDVDQLALETVAGIQAWFTDLQRPAKTMELQNVGRHIGQLAAPKPKTLSQPSVSATVLSYTVTSST